ncbi:hypothetical protein LCGC14_1836220 [marine sediment metagenome]|uniref:Peptidase family U32 C-terminal domain-containing protein n=1 Tax=marine sediment metagenome TaxID=412755 RepID=A0A0F9GEN8_9ZZZZ
MPRNDKIQLNAPAGTLPSLMAAVDAGADSVYIGFRSPTNLRNLPGLNFSVAEAAEGVAYAHRHGVKVHLTVNTLPLDDQLAQSCQAVDTAVEIGADAVIAADWAVLDHAHRRHPHLDIHLSCLAGVTDPRAVRFYRREFGVSCVVLSRMLSIEQIAAVRRETDVLLEVLVFGVLCANYDGRCALSSFITGCSANSMGACAPAKFVEFDQSRQGRCRLMLNGVEINDVDISEPLTYPTPCKGRYRSPVLGRRIHAFQDSGCLNALPLLPELAVAGVDILKIEGRQRSLAYVREVTRAWRAAIDALDPEGRAGVAACGPPGLESLFEGQAASFGALVES